MTLITKSNLFPDLTSLYDNFFDEDRLWNTETSGAFVANVPSANVTENDEEFNIQIAVPGMEKKDFKVDVANGKLNISCEKEEEKKDENEFYTRKEFSYNAFSRSFVLPDSVNADIIKAKYENGILNLTLPKKETAKKMNKKAININ